MSEIDWSKAPEGATHSNRNGTAFHDFSGGSHRHWLIDKWVVHASPFKSYDTPGELVARPWGSEYLPPIGTICIMKGCGADPETIDYAKYKNHIGKKVEIIAHHCVGPMAAVYAYEIGSGEFEYYSMIAGCFEPIPTKEQIASTERESAIKAFMKIGDIYYCDAEKLYDAGARLPGEGKKA